MTSTSQYKNYNTFQFKACRLCLSYHDYQQCSYNICTICNKLYDIELNHICDMCDKCNKILYYKKLKQLTHKCINGSATLQTKNVDASNVTPFFETKLQPQNGLMCNCFCCSWF